MNWQNILQLARRVGASDVHWSSGEPVWWRVDGKLRRVSWEDLGGEDNQDSHYPVFSAPQIRQICAELRREALVSDDELHPPQPPPYSANAFNDHDFAVSLKNHGRFRVNAFTQARGPSLAMRLIGQHVPDLQQLKAPACVANWGFQSHGLILITGPTGSGKSTLLAALLHHINLHRHSHILTLEDPIEFVHTAQQSLIQQREIGRDTPDFESGLRAALREDPDVLLVGEMRDTQSIRLALTAAETGHLVLSTLHTASAPQAVDRLVDAFPSNEKESVRALFAESLVAVLAQTLCPHVSGKGRVAAHEVMVGTPAVKNLVREGKVGQLYSLLQTGQAVGMQTLDQSLFKLFQDQEISAATLAQLSKYPQNSNLMDNHG
jgi:twitching motility protein PilT